MEHKQQAFIGQRWKKDEMLCVEAIASSICDLLILACIRFAIFIINPQCLSFDLIPVFMTQTDPHCPLGDLWDFSASSSDFSNGLSWVFPMTLQIWLIFCRRRAVLLSSTYQHELFLTFRGCFMAWLTDIPSAALEYWISVFILALRMPEHKADHTVWSGRIWGFVTIYHWTRNAFAAIFTFFWVLS